MLRNEEIRRQAVSIADDDLAAIIRYARFAGDPRHRLRYNQGANTVKGYLLSEFGLRIPYRRIRRILNQIDEEAVQFRSFPTARPRRRYEVACPLEMFHIDANCKLRFWRIYFHGCVDGYSRFIVYVKAAGANNAATLQPIFENGCRTNVGCLPFRVRSDRGGENHGAWLAMRSVTEHPRAVIMGPSQARNNHYVTLLCHSVSPFQIWTEWPVK